MKRSQLFADVVQKMHLSSDVLNTVIAEVHLIIYQQIISLLRSTFIIPCIHTHTYTHTYIQLGPTPYISITKTMCCN